MKRILVVLGLVLVSVMGWVMLPQQAIASEYSSPAIAGAKVYFITPEDGETVPPTFVVKFGLSGMGIAPAGVDKDGTGHHHLLIDLVDLPEQGKALPATDQIKHFGNGQTEGTLTLPPGEHTLQLLLANYVHIPHEPPVVSDTITITVE